jgi:hypothetical protein
MPRGKPVDIGTQRFANKTVATGFFKEMLGRYRPGDRVSTEDASHLSGLLAHHQEVEEKVGSGVAHFQVIAAQYGTQCFCLVRTDGSRDDFSYTHCISNA